VRTLYRGGAVYSLSDPFASAMIVDGETVAWIGSDEAADAQAASVDDVVELDGALVTPAFVDAHVHATAAGLLADGLDLTGCGSARALLDAVAARVAARPGAFVWGHGWQDQAWPDELPPRSALDRAAAGAPVYLTRIDVHSALVSSALLDRAPGVTGAPGWSLTALSGDAHHRARRAALAAVDATTRDAAQVAFLAGAAARGVAVVHECAGPDISSADDLAALRVRTGPEVVGYWGEAVRTAEDAAQLVAATGARGLAGDLFVDGSLGSRTAALRAPYADAPGCTGNHYLDAAAIGAHVAACTQAGIQAGFHVIGDAAADALLAGLEEAAAATSPAAVRAAGHRVEHLEMVDAAQARRLAELGVVASVQPLFDAYWGGPDGMYATRLGPNRARGMNPFAGLHEAGVVLALGSDAPVTPVDPWAAVRAAVEHRTSASALTAVQALRAHTVGGYRAAGERSPLAGCLLPGAPASYAIWDGAGPLDGTELNPRCLRLVHRGEVLHDTLGASGTFAP
jgi:predicted amidohydrolase YtcJ